VRRFNWFNYAGNDRFDYTMNGDLPRMVLNPDVVVRSRGVMEKCSMCIQRIQAGKLDAKRQGRPLADGDIATACQQACPVDAIVFGDRNDPASRVSRQGRDPRSYRVLAELDTRPGVDYLAKVRSRA
jgi:molybdopterin-containing oxidoreductase family iron-sulfur binding subunit